MKSGALRRRVFIEKRTVTRGSYGEQVITWSTFRETWAEVRDILLRNNERDEQGLRTVTNQVQVTLRWITGLASDMRIRCRSDGRLLQIVAIQAMPKKVGYAVMCQEYSADGNA